MTSSTFAAALLSFIRRSAEAVRRAPAMLANVTAPTAATTSVSSSTLFHRARSALAATIPTSPTEPFDDVTWMPRKVEDPHRKGVVATLTASAAGGRHARAGACHA